MEHHAPFSLRSFVGLFGGTVFLYWILLSLQKKSLAQKCRTFFMVILSGF